MNSYQNRPRLPFSGHFCRQLLFTSLCSAAGENNTITAKMCTKTVPTFGHYLRWQHLCSARKVDVATCKREFKLPWREAGPPNHHDDKVGSDQQVVNNERSLSAALAAGTCTADATLDVTWTCSRGSDSARACRERATGAIASFARGPVISVCTRYRRVEYIIYVCNIQYT